MAEPMVVVDDLNIVYKVYGSGGDRGGDDAADTTGRCGDASKLLREELVGLQCVDALDGQALRA